MSEELDSSSDLAQQLLKRGYALTWSKGEALRWASSKGFADLVRCLLAEGADPLQRNTESGFTSLISAVVSGSRETFELLLSAGADINERCTLGNRGAAIHLAARINQPATLACLISLGANINCRNDFGTTPFHIAAKHGCCDVLQALMDLGADTQPVDTEGNHPLHYACLPGSYSATKLLVKMGANISCANEKGITPLHVVAWSGNLKIVKLLIESGADVSATDKEGANALHYTHHSGSGSIATFLLGRGIDAEHKNVTGETPLAVMARTGCTEILGLLLAKGADINTRNNEGLQPIHLAAWHGREEIMRILLEQGADIEAIVEREGNLLIARGADINKRHNEGLQPIHLAAWHSQEEIIRILLEQGADIEAKIKRDGNVENIYPETGETPLLVASVYGGLHVILSLLDHGANVAAASDSGWQAVHYAALYDKKFLLQLLMRHGVDVDARTNSGRTPLQVATIEGYQEMVSMLIEHGADVNAREDDSRHALHQAARYGHSEIVELLLENGADVFAETKDGLRPQDLAQTMGHFGTANLLREWTPGSSIAKLDSAAHSITLQVSLAGKGHIDRVLQILNKGVPVNSVNQDGRTALSLAAENGHSAMVRVLIEKGADVSLTDAGGESALWWASRYGRHEVALQLLTHGAPVDTPDCEGQSPLSAASQHGQVELVELLLHRGSNPNSETTYGKTPLLFAAAAGYQRVVQLLLDSGANAEYLTPEGNTAMTLASENGHQEVIDLLERSQTKSEAIYDEDICRAAEHGRIAEMLRLIELGANVHGVDGTDTPIYIAASHGQQDMIKLLITHGANVHVSNSQGYTALATAAWFGHAAVVRILHEYGAKIEQTDPHGRVPLSLAVINKQKEVVRLLLELRARTEPKDNSGRTPLWHAADQSTKDIVELLLVNEANKEFGDTSGITPLMAAVMRRDRNIAELLLERGSSMRPDSIFNYSPLCRAAFNGDEAMVDLLLDYQANMNHLSDHKTTALHLAAREGHPMVVKMLIEAGSDNDAKDDRGRAEISYAKETGLETIVKLLSQAQTLLHTDQRAPGRAQRKYLDRKPPYWYRSLAKERSIRVMRLHPGKPDDIIKFDLVKVEVGIDLDFPFDALSYEWMDTIGTVPVQCNNEQLLITPNCKAAILALRQESKHRFLWIDAVCINQENLRETSQQMALMIDIYRNAKSVILWLGSGSASTDSAFDRISDMARVFEMIQKDNAESVMDLIPLRDCEDAQTLALSVTTDADAASGFNDLYWHSYFSRVWIFQEIILAGSRGVAVCGGRKCSSSMFKNALLAYEQSTGNVNRRFRSLIFVEDAVKRAELELPPLLLAITSLQATNPQDKIFVALNLSRLLGVDAQQPVTDYNMTVQEAYVYATRHFVSRIQDAQIWMVGNRRSAKSISGLPTWVPDYQQSWQDEHENSFLKFPQPAPFLGKTIPTDAFSNESSLYIHGYLIDRIVFRLTVTRDVDIYEMLLPAVLALASQGRSIYDVYPGKGSGSNSSCEVVGLGETGESKVQTPEKNDDVTNGQVLLGTVMDIEGVSAKESLEILSYLAWALSHDQRAPPQSRTVPGHMLEEVASWNTRSEASKYFNLQVLKRAEDKLYYDKDLVYTENGYFGITNGGEAEEGLAIAVVAGAKYLTMLERKQNEDQKCWFEYVDDVYMNYARKVEKLEEISGGAKMERLEIR